MPSKEQTIEKIIQEYEGKYTVVCKNPDYNLSEGLPPINLQVTTGKSIDLYLIIDVNTSETAKADIRDGACALVDAMRMARENYAKVHGYLLCINLPEKAQKNLYEYSIRQLLRALERPLPKPQKSKPFYSMTEYSGHRMAKVGLN